MEIQELSPLGDFSNWTPKALSEVKEKNFTTKVGEQLVFENDMIKVWTIKLLPNSSLPFHKHTLNYNWTALTNGTAISCYETGRIVKLTYEKGDFAYYNHDQKGDFIHNLKNIGNKTLKFVTVEYK